MSVLRLLATAALSAPFLFATTELPAQGTTQGSKAAALPNGASSINENYGDWTVSCAVDKGQKSCGLSQSQGNQQTAQRSFAIELRAPRDGAAEGTILMPFGLRLEAGALLKLDGKDLGQGVRFSTCVPQGCLMPIVLPKVATDAMRNGKTLIVAALSIATGQAIKFDVSLSGFGAALERTERLGQ